MTSKKTERSTARENNPITQTVYYVHWSNAHGHSVNLYTTEQAQADCAKRYLLTFITHNTSITPGTLEYLTSLPTDTLFKIIKSEDPKSFKAANISYGQQTLVFSQPKATKL